jgi:ribonuclease P protein component
MIRPTPVGPFWGRKWPAFHGLLASADNPHLTGKLSPKQASCQRRSTREAHLSTFQTGAQAPPWLPRPPCHGRWPQGPRCTPRARPQASERLNPGPPLQRDLTMDRLRQRADFLAVANGARTSTAAFVVQRRRRNDDGPVRLGFTVTKKNGTATERNRIRRRLRELVKRLPPLSLQPHCDYVLVGRRAALMSDFSHMLGDLRQALHRLEAPTTHRAPQPKRTTRP